MSDTLNTLKVITGNNTPGLKQVTSVLDQLHGLKYELIYLPSFESKSQRNRFQGDEVSDIFQGKANQAVLQGKADFIIQSAADLLYPLPAGLEVIALLEDIKQTGSKETIDSFRFNKTNQDARSKSVLPTERNGHLAIVALQNRPELKALFSLNDIRNQFGKITLVGFGPGNPELLTLGGDKALSQSDIIFHDDLLDKDYLQKYAAEKVYVGKRKGIHRVEQAEINRLILDAAKSGKQVVRLKGGDPMIFAHGGEEVEYLERNFVEVEVIPGVSAGIALASLLKIPITHRGISSSVAFISGHSEHVHLPDTDTLIIYMGGSNIQAIARKAIEQGRNPEIPVMMVYNLSLPDQQEFFFTLEELTLTDQKFPTPIIIIIGEVVAFRSKPTDELLKANILVSETFTTPFYELGNGPERLQSFEWLIFTNRHTVRFFFEALEKIGKDSRNLAGIKIAAVGKAAVGALKEHGIRADLIPELESPEGLLSKIQELSITPSKALIPLFFPGNSFLEQRLKEKGWVVRIMILSRNILRKNFSPLAFHPSAEPRSHRYRRYPAFYDYTGISYDTNEMSSGVRKVSLENSTV